MDGTLACLPSFTSLVGGFGAVKIFAIHEKRPEDDVGRELGSTVNVSGVKYWIERDSTG